MGKLAWLLLFSAPILFLSGCKDSPSTQAQPPAQPSKPIAVDVAVAEFGSLDTLRQYTGTTNPVREVLLRARVEGQLVELNADRGDRVQQGQLVARQDDGVLTANLLQAEAELAAREGELARTQTLVANAQAQVARAQLEYQQSLADAKRLQQLAQLGAVTTQQAEQASTKANSNLQTLRSAEALVKSQQAEIVTAQKRVDAQRAIVQQAKERRSFTLIISPVDGIVMEKKTEAGNLLQPSNELLKIGDFSQVKVIVEVSELDRSRLAPGQTTKVRLDAFPKKELTGQISLISPSADPQSRLVSVEVTIPNPDQSIGSGLLARVTFLANPNQSKDPVLVAPLSALATAGRPNSPENNKKRNKLFVIQRSGEETTVKARPIEVGKQQDGKVVILSGLSPGEEYVIRSGRPLKDGDKVVLSALSATGKENDRPRN